MAVRATTLVMINGRRSEVKKRRKESNATKYSKKESGLGIMKTGN